MGNKDVPDLFKAEVYFPEADSCPLHRNRLKKTSQICSIPERLDDFSEVGIAELLPRIVSSKVILRF